MVQFAQCVKEFAKWKGKEHEPERRAFISELASIINECGLAKVGSTVERAAYDWFSPRFHIDDHVGNPYTLTTLER